MKHFNSVVVVTLFGLTFGSFLGQAAFAALSLNCAEPQANQALFNLHFDSPTQISLYLANPGNSAASQYLFDPALTTQGFVGYRNAQGGEIKIARDLVNGPGRRAPIWVENGVAGAAYVCESALIGE